jgi:hypothetical protein
MEKLGRRLTMVISLTVGGVALLANAAVDLTGNSGDGFFVYFNTVMFGCFKSARNYSLLENNFR